MRKISLLLLLMSFTRLLSAQPGGTLLSPEMQPLKDARLMLQGDVIAITDENGRFLLPDTVVLPVELQVSHSCCATQLVKVSSYGETLRLSEVGKSGELDEVVIAADAIRDPSHLLPADLVTARQFEQYTPADLVPALNQSAGIYVQSGALNTHRITIRGVGSRTPYGSDQVKAYLNQIPVTNGAGETAIDLFNPEDIYTIEVIKGPRATLYGSSLGGTILMSTKTPGSEEKSLSTAFTAGSYGLLKNSSSLDISEKKWSMHFNYDHLETEGFRENSAYNRNGYLLTGMRKLNENNELSLVLNHVFFRSAIPSSLDEATFRTAPRQAADNWALAAGYEQHLQTMAGLSLTHSFTSGFNNTTSIFYHYADHYEPRPFNILDEYAAGYGARTLFTKDFYFRKRLARFDLGAEGFREYYHWETFENLYEENNGNGSLKGEQLSNNREVRDRLDVFASTVLPLSQRLSSRLGVNVRNTVYDYRDDLNAGAADLSARRSFDPFIAPSFSLTYLLTADDRLFANASRGATYPGLEETLNPDGTINTEIGPETGWSYELGSELYFFRRKMFLNVTAYWMDISGLLVAERVGEDQYVGRNAGRTAHRGVEISVRHRFMAGAALSITPFTNASFNFHEFVAFTDEGEDLSGNALTGVPEQKINAGLTIRHRSGISFSGNFLHVGRIPLNDENEIYSRPYEVVDLRIGYERKFMENLKTTVALGMNNALDEQYAASVLINATGFGNSRPRYYYPGTPRNLYARVGLNYRF